MKKFQVYRNFLMKQPPLIIAVMLLIFFVVFGGILMIFTMKNNRSDTKKQYHVITIYDEETEKTVISTAGKVADALKSAQISINEHDSIDHDLDQKLEEAIMVINIHRARPIVITDGERQTRVITAAQSTAEIAAIVGINLHPEDLAELSLVDNLLWPGGAGLEMNIIRAKIVNLRLYGQDLLLRTQKTTVEELLEEKNIKLGSNDNMDLELTTKIENNLKLHIWREGLQTVTTTEIVPFTTKIITDSTRKVGYRETQVKGRDGQKTVIYEITTHDGEEVNRKILNEIIDIPAIEQVEIVGIKSSLEGVPPLTAQRGAQTYWVGPILRKETFYDLPMNVVMRNCGQGGHYTVRSDGVKIDRDGFVIVAANLDRYPRCSEVDTSLGRGKVYDTGGFATRNPEQFDLATDWTNHNGI
ncbi:G5 domain-containing protein [Candidatus Saccharibacteria bacterium]|nr:G5 domain-containing protein [Candidatus Saccharibacteria bacterium]